MTNDLAFWGRKGPVSLAMIVISWSSMDTKMGQRVKPGCIARNLYRFPGVTKKVAIGSLVSFCFSNTFSLRTFSPFLVLLYFLFDWKLSSKNLPFPFIIKDSPPSCWPFQWFKRYSSRVYYPKNGFQSLFKSIYLPTVSFTLSVF